MSTRRMDEIGLQYDPMSVANALMECRHHDLQVFLNKDEGFWVARWWENTSVPMDDEDRWGAVVQARTFEELMQEVAHAIWDS